MNYTKVSFHLNPDNQLNREILVAVMSQYDFESFDENAVSVKGFCPGEEIDLDEIRGLASGLEFEIEIETELIEDQNWNEVWEKNYFKPLLITDECLIRAPFHKEYPNAKYEIVIEPNMAFGTGNHETTSLMAERILSMDFTGKQVLDMGCGTGILAILASLKGAEKITAIDIDSWAFESTVENARVNNIENIEAHLGDASLLTNQHFDVIFANIQKNIIIRDLEIYNRVLNLGGEIILSGFYNNDAPDVKRIAEHIGLKESGVNEKNNWVATTFKK